MTVVGISLYCLFSTTSSSSLWIGQQSEVIDLAKRAIRLDQPMDNYAEVLRKPHEDSVLLETALSVQLRALRRQAWSAIINMECEKGRWEELAQWFRKRCRLVTQDEGILEGQLRELRKDWEGYLSLCTRSRSEEDTLEKIRSGATLVAEEAVRTAKDLDARDIRYEQANSIPPREMGFGFKVPYLPLEVGGVVGMGGPGGLRGSVRVGLLPNYPFRQQLQDAFQN